MEVGVQDVAAQLGLSDRRVRQLIAAGDLPARRVAGRLLVDEASIPRSRPVARPMSPRIAWAFVSLLSGEEMDVSARERARLVAKRRELLAAPNSAVLLRSWLRQRAKLLRFNAGVSELAELLADRRVVPSGISDPRSGLSPGQEVEAYVRPADLPRLVDEYLMAEVPPTNVWLHVVDRVLPRPAPLGVVIADLADRDLPREDGRVRALLTETA